MCVASEETHWKKSCDGKLLFIFFPNTIAQQGNVSGRGFINTEDSQMEQIKPRKKTSCGYFSIYLANEIYR